MVADSVHVLGEHAQGGGLRPSPSAPRGNAEGLPPGRVPPRHAQIAVNLESRAQKNRSHLQTYLKLSLKSSVTDLSIEVFKYIWSQEDISRRGTPSMRTRPGGRSSAVPFGSQGGGRRPPPWACSPTTCADSSKSRNSRSEKSVPTPNISETVFETFCDRSFSERFQKYMVT